MCPFFFINSEIFRTKSQWRRKHRGEIGWIGEKTNVRWNWFSRGNAFSRAISLTVRTSGRSSSCIMKSGRGAAEGIPTILFLVYAVVRRWGELLSGYKVSFIKSYIRAPFACDQTPFFIRWSFLAPRQTFDHENTFPQSKKLFHFDKFLERVTYFVKFLQWIFVVIIVTNNSNLSNKQLSLSHIFLFLKTSF